jgi:predicted AlkP superfamily phosphohydrolase/phosphomutase
VSVALAGREPEGTVAPADYERVRDEIAESLLAFTDPDTGRHPIGAVRRREEVLSGAYLERAPDLLLEPAPLYSLTHARHMVEAADWLSGDHRPEGVYVAAGPGFEPPESEIQLSDFSGIVLRALGVESQPHMPAVAPAADVFSADEEREVEERLRGLGYLE